jgi:hypothetical protein
MTIQEKVDDLLLPALEAALDARAAQNFECHLRGHVGYVLSFYAFSLHVASDTGDDADQVRALRESCFDSSRARTFLTRFVISAEGSAHVQLMDPEGEIDLEQDVSVVAIATLYGEEMDLETTIVSDIKIEIDSVDIDGDGDDECEEARFEKEIQNHFDALLIDWIHRVETVQDKHNSWHDSKRLHSMITENYFEKELAEKVCAGSPEDLAFGWTYRTNWASDNRHWFKISDGSGKESSAAFIRSIHCFRPGDRFFLIIDMNCRFESASVPDVSLTVKEIVVEKNLIIYPENLSRDVQRMPHEITTRIKAELEKREGLQVAQPYASRFRKHYSSAQLQRLLITRCIMNFGGLYLTDIDAVGISRCGQIQMIEFKRKTAAQGKDWYAAVPDPEPWNRLAEYRSRIKSLREELPSKMELKRAHNEGQRYQLVRKGDALVQAQLAEHSKWAKRPPELIFGLDDSHASNVALCCAGGMLYTHLVWESSCMRADELLDENLKPLTQPVLLCLDILPEHFCGLTKTNGVKSGTYDHGVRFQVTIRKEEFKPVRE